MKRNLLKQLDMFMRILFILSILCCAVIFLRYIFYNKWELMFLIWNLFLCWIPLQLSILILKRQLNMNKGRSWVDVILFMIWLLFYPNALYIITDLVHFSREVIFLPFDKIATMDIGYWMNFNIIVVTVIIGFIMGIISLYIIQSIFTDYYGSTISWGVVVFVLILSSYGIYIGRFYRLNSWDVFRPLTLIHKIIQSFNMNMFIFVGIFSISLLCLYLLFYSLMGIRRED